MMIYCALEGDQVDLREKVTKLINTGLDSHDPEVQKVYARLIGYISKRDRASFIKQGLNNPDLEVQRVYAWMIGCVLEGDRVDLIKQGLNNPDPEVQRVCAGRINHVLEGDQVDLREKVFKLINTGLDSPDPEVQKVYAGMIDYVSERDRANLIKQGLDNPDPEVQRVCAGMIYCALEGDQFDLREKVFKLINTGLDSPDPEVQKVYARMINNALKGEQDDLREKVIKLINIGLDNPDPEVQRVYAGMIDYVSERDRANLIKQGLDNPDPEVQRVCARRINYVSERDKTDILRKINENKLEHIFIEPPLYDNKLISKDKFTRKSFTKTGSETTLVGGDLKDKVIVRHLKPEAFRNWQTLYEDHNLWKNAGFDYVPIEPIVSFHLNKDGLVDVYSGILDLNFDDWNNKTGGKFYNELLEERNKILSILSSLGIKHGHDHNRNFCLRFFRDSSGKVDLTRQPRIYLIDFDEAVS